MSLVAKNIKPGSLQGYGEGDYGGDLVLVGARLAAVLGVQPGDSISLVSPSGVSTPFGSNPTSKAYTIGGIFSVGMSEYDQTYVYMPLQQAQLVAGYGIEGDAKGGEKCGDEKGAGSIARHWEN